MKQDIEFRAKDLNGEGWVYGSYLYTYDGKNHPIGGKPIKDKHQIVQYNAGDWGMGGWVHYDVDPDTLGQYTGMKDKNGWKIYKGDYIEYHDDPQCPECRHAYKVCWSDEYMQWWADGVFDSNGDPLCELDTDFIKVVGNVFDNPELLEKENIDD